jgi:DNA polymerase-3 subunit delta'
VRFQDIYGHEKPLSILKAAMATNRAPHAYLFYGMEGVGKKTVASVFARALNCTGEDRPCGQCASCLRAEHNNHPNIVSIAAEGQFIKIDAVRQIQARMAFRPEGGKRVFIITEADRMNPPAANALLKTLEEPAADNVLILTTARLHALPITILSRCQKLRFSPLSKSAVARFLMEKNGMPADEAEAVAAASIGSIGYALEIKKEDYMAIRNDILNRLAKDDPADLIRRLTFAGSLGKDREGISRRLQIIENAYRDSLVFKETRNKDMLLYKDGVAAIEAIARRLPERDIIKNIKEIEKAADALARNANKALTLEAMVVSLA